MVIPRPAIVAAVVAAVVMGIGTVAGAILGTGGGGSDLQNGAPLAATVSMNPNFWFRLKNRTFIHRGSGIFSCSWQASHTSWNPAASRSTSPFGLK